MMNVFEQKMLQKFKQLLAQPDIEIEYVPGSVEYPVNGYKLIHKIPADTEKTTKNKKEYKLEQILFIERYGIDGAFKSIKITNCKLELSKEFKQLLVDIIHDKYNRDEKKKEEEEEEKKKAQEQKILEYLDSFISAGRDFK